MDSIKKLNKVNFHNDFSYVHNFRQNKNVFVKSKRSENVAKKKNGNDLPKRNGVSSKKRKIVENELKWKNSEKSRRPKDLPSKKLEKKWKRSW